MTEGSLQDRLVQAGNAASMLRGAQTGRYVFPVPPEFSNWVEEQRAWRETAVLFDQSFHMTDLYVSGPDTLRLLSDLAVNSLRSFGRNKAKQLVCCNHDGYVIGDAIVFGLEDDQVNIVGRPVLPNWVQYHAETGGYDVTVERDERTADNPDAPRKTYRYEVQGPNAMKILERVNEGGPLTTRFFNMGEITVAGCRARTLSHGMGGAEGLELFGPVEDGPRVKAALIEAGAPFGIRQAGARAYSSAATESGWIASPLPAIYTGETMRPYREWLGAGSFEAVASLGGSYHSDDIADYYLTPWDLDYGRVVKFDHDFIGRAALEEMATRPHRQKVTLVWDRESVLSVFAGLMDRGAPPKMLEMPTAHYAGHPYDRVLCAGRIVGISTSVAYSANERAWLSLAMVEPALAETGTRVSLIWGEPGGTPTRPSVERHHEVEIAATVYPWPIHEQSRRNYRNRR